MSAVNRRGTFPAAIIVFRSGKLFIQNAIDRFEPDRALAFGISVKPMAFDR